MTRSKRQMLDGLDGSGTPLEERPKWRQITCFPFVFGIFWPGLDVEYHLALFNVMQSAAGFFAIPIFASLVSRRRSRSERPFWEVWPPIRPLLRYFLLGGGVLSHPTLLSGVLWRGSWPDNKSRAQVAAATPLSDLCLPSPDVFQHLLHLHLLGADHKVSRR